ncbi:hypothetical protein [Cohnella sp. WQ 127256]|uniref:hypothetical protein n=1 Tax=Cohnella sp. WQ 127256 TaxID=2938790 RepID=UPI00211935C6|nr:hypothetical protein [Cohnella sp. WQ 127256]
MKKKIVVVLGMHRSGTSALANSLVRLGAYPGGNLMPGDSANPRGYWEDLNLVALNETILKRLNQRWQSIDNPLLNRCEHFLPLLEEEFLARAIQLLNEHLQAADTVLIKDPRICVLLPFWKLAFERLGVEVKYVLALRNPLNSAQSLLKRDLIELEHGVKLWAYYTLMAIAQLNAPLLISSYDSLLGHTTEELHRLALFVGSNASVSEWNPDELTYLDATLRHHHQDGQRLEGLLGKEHIVVRMYQTLLDAANTDTWMPGDEVRKLSLRFARPLAYDLGYRGSENAENYAQVFIDTGEGFSERQSQRSNFQGRYRLEISLVKQGPVDHFRLDPGLSCCLAIVHQAEFEHEGSPLPNEIIGGNYQVRLADRVFLFENDDPQIVYRLNGQPISRAVFQISVFPLDEFAHSLLNSLKMKQIEELNNALSGLGRENVELKERIRLHEATIEEWRLASEEKQLALEENRLALEKWQRLAWENKQLAEEQKLETETFTKALDERKTTHAGAKQALSRSFRRIARIVGHPRRSWRIASDKRRLKPIFDEYYYLYHNKELRRGPFDLLEHFTVAGWKEGRSPNPRIHMESLLRDNPNHLLNPLLTAKNKTIKEVIFHVGLHKTGTSSIQESLYLEKNNQLLESKGILYPRSIAANHSVTFYSLFSEYPERYHMNIKRGLSEAEIGSANREYVRDLLDELRKRKGDKLVISGEDISKLSTNGLIKLREFIHSVSSRKLNIRVVVYVRHPVKWAISAYQERIKNGETGKTAWGVIDKELNGLFQKRIQKFVDVFGPECTSVYSFEQALDHPQGIVGHFLSNLGIKGDTLERLRLIRSNESLSLIAADLISYLNDQVPLTVDGRLNPEHREQDFELLHKVRGPAFDVPTEYKERICAQASCDIRWLSERFAINYSKMEISSLPRVIVLSDEAVEDIRAASSNVSEPLKSILVEYVNQRLPGARAHS